MKMSLPNEEGYRKKLSNMFTCNTCGKKRYDFSLAYQCENKKCKRFFCKECYSLKISIPNCSGCNKCFCWMCSKRNECVTCHLLICDKCLCIYKTNIKERKKYHGCNDHLFLGVKSDDDDERKMSPDELRAQKAKVKELIENKLFVCDECVKKHVYFHRDYKHYKCLGGCCVHVLPDLAYDTEDDKKLSQDASHMKKLQVMQLRAKSTSY